MNYLDCAATTKPKQEVVDIMMKYMNDEWYNPSSLYSDSVKVKTAVDSARDTIAKFISAKSGNEIYFTSGGSESNNWAIQGFINNRLDNLRVPHIITTKIEHKSIMGCVKNQKLAMVHYLDVDEYGFVSMYELEDIITELINIGIEPKDILVSIQFANNEIGTIQDVINIGNIVHMYGCIFHTDAVQAFGHVYIDVDVMGIDMLSASSHKIGGCKGAGFLYIKNGIEINPLIYGSQMDGMRGGTENVPGIMGMSKAVKLSNWRNSSALRDTRDYFIEKLLGIGCKLNGSIKTRLPNNINVVLPDNIYGENLLYMLDIDGIQIGTGSACNSHSIESSYVLKAIGLTDNEAKQSIRITIPDDITMDKIDEIVESIKKAIEVLKIENNIK